MEDPKVLEEKLRESACIGDLDELRNLLKIKNVDINSKNTTNGWTALHWAAKRNHESIVSYLLNEGADPNITNNNGEKAAEVTSKKEVQIMLGGDGTTEMKTSNLPITPNYLANPPFPYIKNDRPSQTVENTSRFIQTQVDELVLKARLANSDERDFIEVELPLNTLTFEALLTLLCTELNLDKQLIYKVRKLPNTIIRKDKDVKRLTSFQEIEVCLSNKVLSASSRNYGVVGGSLPKQEQILY